MNRTISTFLLILIAITGMNAQSIREVRINVIDADRMGFSIEFNFEQKILQDAWDKKCDELSLKGKGKPFKGGLNVFTGVLVPDIHFESIDLYEDIERGGDKTRSTFSITVSKGNTNFISSEEAKLVTSLKSFLDKFIVYAEQYKLSLDIKAQEDQIMSTQKLYDKMIEDGKKLQLEIDENKLDQANKVKELEALNKALEELKLRVKR